MTNHERDELIDLIWGDADAVESLSIEGAADAILAAGYRKHPEPEWEYGVGWVYQDNFITGFPMDSLEEAQAHAARYPEDEGTRLENFVVLRRPERYSGPWVPYEEGTA